jgi:ELWxxDGT repeat protein
MFQQPYVLGKHLLTIREGMCYLQDLHINLVKGNIIMRHVYAIARLFAICCTPLYITNVAGSAFFNTVDGWLWKSDGTAAGTIQLLEPSPGVPSSNGGYAGDFVDLNGLLLFTAQTENGRSLWRSDGSEAGTIQVYVPE